MLMTGSTYILTPEKHTKDAHKKNTWATNKHEVLAMQETKHQTFT